MKDRNLYYYFSKLFNITSFQKLIVSLSIFLFISCVTTNKQDSVQEKKAAQSAETVSANSSKENNVLKGESAAQPTPKNHFTQKEMELFYNNVLGKKIIIKNKKFLPVTDNKKPVFINCDCDNDGYTEFYVLFTESISENDVSIDNVSDLRNIYREDIYLREFLISVYKYYETNEEKKFINEQNIILEGKGAFSSLKEIEIDKNSKFYGISVNFITSVGTHEDLVINRRGRCSITSIKNTISDSTRKDDIDYNGVLDLIRYERVFVDGFGVETFITWYKFSGEKFLPVKTVNTVKDLRSFIKDSQLYLETKKIDLFIKNTISPPVLKKLSLAKISSDKILQRIFYPVKRESSFLIDINTMLSSNENIDFIFPEIFENPFRMDSDGVYSFTTYVRVLLKDGNMPLPQENKDSAGENAANEEIYLVKIYMAHNPFEDRRFFFFVN